MVGRAWRRCGPGSGSCLRIDASGGCGCNAATGQSYGRNPGLGCESSSRATPVFYGGTGRRQGMAKHTQEPVLVVASATELPSAQRVWGTGGWLPPEQREALDWLTLARFLGWGVAVTRYMGTGFD